MLKIKLILLAVFWGITSTVSLSALENAQTNFMISPTPVPWFEFQKGQVDLRLGGAFLYVSSEESKSGAGDELDILGGGFNAFGRYAFNDYLALDLGCNFSGGREYKNPDIDVGLFMMNLPADLELQPFKNKYISIIIFAGASFSRTFIYAGFWSGIPDKSPWYEYDIWATMYGPQAGIQIAVKAGDFALTPYFMMQRISGSISAKEYQGHDDRKLLSEFSEKIDPFNMMLFGFDVVYRPWNLTLSSVLQQLMKSGDNRNIRSFFFTLSYDFQWGGEGKMGPGSETEPVGKNP